MSTQPQAPIGMSKLAEVLINNNELDWRPKSLKGVFEKVLWRDDASGGSINMIKFDKGTSNPQRGSSRECQIRSHLTLVMMGR